MFKNLQRLNIPGHGREYESQAPSLATSSTPKTVETPRSISSHCRFSRLLSPPVAMGGEQPIESQLFGTCFGIVDSSNRPLSAFQLISGSTIEIPTGHYNLSPNTTPAFLEKKRRRRVVIAPVSIEVASVLGVGGSQAECVGLSPIFFCSAPNGTSPGPFGPHGIQMNKVTRRELPKAQILCFESLSTGRRSPIPSQSPSLASRDPLHQHNIASQNSFEERMGDPTPKDSARFGDALVVALQSCLNYSPQVSPEQGLSYWSASESESESDSGSQRDE